MALLKLSIDPKAVSRHSSAAFGMAESDNDFESVSDFRQAVAEGDVEITAAQVQRLDYFVNNGFIVEIGEDGSLSFERTDLQKGPATSISNTFQQVPSATALLVFAEDVVRLLYEDVDSGRLTGENTVSSRSCADFIDALECTLSRRHIKPRLEEPTIEPKGTGSR